MFWFGVGLAALSLLLVICTRYDQRHYAFGGFVVGLCIIIAELLGLSRLGVLLIILGALLSITTYYLSTRVVGAPWKYGFSISLIFLWIVYILFLVVVPGVLIIYGITIL